MYRTKMGQARKYMNQVGEGGDGGSGGSGGQAIDVNNPEIQKLIQERIEKEVSGLKSKNSELLGKLKETSEKFKAFEGVDIEKVRNLQKQMEENEEMRLLAEGKVEDVVSRRIALKEKDWQNQYSALESRVGEYESIIKQKDERLKELVIDGQIREAYMQLGYEPSLLKLITKEARDVFIMTEDGKAVPRDQNGNIIYSKDAKTPVSALSWLEMQAEAMPSLRGVNKGAGTQQNRGTGKVDTSKMSSAQRIAEGLRQRGLA